MTGIAAIFSRGPADLHRLDRMLSGMAGRAFDGEGRWVQGRFALGAAILHTTAESLEADLPHTNEDHSLAVVIDGHLNNWEELRQDLIERGAVLRNRSDAELVLRAYEQWGEACANRIEGDFAFIIADTRAHRIFAARNHQGTKPLFYHIGKDALIIGSDIKTVLCGLDSHPEPNRDYLIGVAAMQFNLPEETVWRGVTRLLQAHYLVSDGEGCATRRYFDLPFDETIRYASDGEYAEHYRAVLFDSVRRVSRSHRPLGIAVSGGLDSSAVFGIADALEKQGQLLAPGFQGYTLAPEPGTTAYELPFARAATSRVGRGLTEVPLFEPPLNWYTDRAREDADLPTTTNGAMMMGIEQRIHADGARVFLTGDGGDEWLQGNNSYFREFLQDADFKGFWQALRGDARVMGWPTAVRAAARVGFSGYLPGAIKKVRRERLRRKAYGPDSPLFWLTRESRAILEHQRASYDRFLPDDPREASKTNLFYSPASAFGRAITERHGNMNGIEYRHPMLTRQFIAFSIATPEHMRRRGGVTKVIHRLAMQGILPPEIIDRHTKADFQAQGTDIAMAQFSVSEAGKYLEGIHDRAGLKRLVKEVSRSSVDFDYCWEIWGAYAVAAFLMHADQAHPPRN